jgi:hypothetical protein
VYTQRDSNETSKVQFPEIRDFADLQRSMPYLADDEKTGLPVCSLARDSEPSHTKRKTRKVNPDFDTTRPLPEGSKMIDRAKQHINKSESFATFVFDEILKRLVYPPYSRIDIHGRVLARAAVVHSIRESRGNAIPILDIAVANELLQEAGDFTHAATNHKVVHSFPPCKNHIETNTCVGTTLGFKGFTEGGKPEGVPFMMFMYRDELIKFLKTKERPVEERPCLACMRHDQSRFLLSLACVKRDRVKDPSAAMLDTYVYKPDSMWQWYKELKDQVGGYYHAYMAIASDTVWQGFIDSFVMICYSTLVAVKDKETRRWYLDQSALVYTHNTSSSSSSSDDHHTRHPVGTSMSA